MSTINTLLNNKYTNLDTAVLACQIPYNTNNRHYIQTQHNNRQTALSALRCCPTIFPLTILEMWANAQRDGRPAEHRWRPLFNAAKFG